MTSRFRTPLFALSLLALLTACSQPQAGPADVASLAFGAPLINEVLGSTTGTDVEYVELVAAEGTSFDGLSIVVVESDAGSSNGTIDFRLDLDDQAVTCESGFFLIGTASVAGSYGVVPDVEIASNSIENSSYTLALVETASLSGSSVTGGEVVLDAVAVTDGGASDTFFFGAPVVGPDGSFLPAGARRAEDGVDTDTAGDWLLADFNLGPDNTPTASGCDDGGGGGETVAIHDVQGSGFATPLDGEVVTIEAIVVGDFQSNAGDDDGDLSGFFVQEEDADVDADPATSEGLFVFDRGGDVDVSVGDLVRVTGIAGEFRDTTQISLQSVEIVSQGNDLPSEAAITLPADAATYERLEGMRVVFPQSLQISEYFNYDRFGEIVLSLPLEGLPRAFQPTAYDTVAETGLTPEETQAAIAARRITLDDGRSDSNPAVTRHPNGAPFSLDNRFRGGDTVTNARGVISNTFGYRIEPTAPADYAAVNARSAAPDDVGGDLTVAAFNVLNYFPTIDTGAPICGPNFDQGCRGADSAEEFARQQAKIVAALAALDADVVGLIEIQNNAGAVQNLVDALNAALGADVYVAVEDGTIGGDAIKVSMIYQPAAVALLGGIAVLDTPEFVAPNTPGDPKNRAALAQSFADPQTGGAFTVVVNHLKSKGSGCGPGDDDPLAGSCNLTRTLAVQALLDWLATDPTGAEDSDVLIVGDLNSYDEEDPIAELLAAGYAGLLEAFGGEFAYSYVFDGQLGHLDYALSSASLTPQVTGTTAWHINADEPDLLDYDTSFKSPEQGALFEPDAYRSSDHDPVLVGLGLAVDPATLIELLLADVEALAADGTLNRGNANALSKKLENALAALQRGNANAAAGQLGAFANQVDAFGRTGKLPAGVAADLAERARRAAGAL